MIAPSPWVVCHLPLVAVGGRVLDLACGRGRHARLLAAAGYEVVAVDRDFAAISGLQEVAGITALRFDLEGGDWPLAGERFAGVIVTNYLWRPRLPDVCALVDSGGVLIYETFMVGNEVYGKPSTPDFLLRDGEPACRGQGRRTARDCLCGRLYRQPEAGDASGDLRRPRVNDARGNVGDTAC